MMRVNERIYRAEIADLGDESSCTFSTLDFLTLCFLISSYLGCTNKMSMIAGPSRLPRRIARVMITSPSRSLRHASGNILKGKKKFDPVIFTGIQPTGACSLSRD